MEIHDIARRRVTVAMDPEEALVIAQALENARSDSLFDREGSEVTTQLLDCMAAVFSTAALAAGMHSFILEREGDKPSYQKMRDGKMLDPGYAVLTAEGRYVLPEAAD